MNTLPLVVDLDGTLLQSDMLVESYLEFFRGRPLKFLSPIRRLVSGKARLKEYLAESTDIDVSGLPYNSEVLALIEKERSAGRKIVLATATHAIYAQKIADHLQLFDRVFSTSAERNLSAKNKRDLLVSEFGEKGFDYVGNAQDDLPVWAAARGAYLVNPDNGVERKAEALGNIEHVIKTRPYWVKTWLKGLRVHQWLKNLLIFVPLLASHRIGELGLIFNGALAFLLFGLCASSVYLLNDLLDLTDDRHHLTKRNRPLAAGHLSVKAGLFAAPLLLLLSFGGALLFLPWTFSLALACYYLLTLAYSIVLKKRMVVDVIALAMLYTLRIIAGTFAFQVSLTFWMLAFSMFIFLSLALVKRYAELCDARDRGVIDKMRGRGYYPSDLEMVSSLGAASGYLSVMVLALYIQDESIVALYSNPHVIWLACPLLLFWISRVWMITHRGQMHDDPVIFAVRDRVSIIVGLLFGVVFWLAV